MECDGSLVGFTDGMRMVFNLIQWVCKLVWQMVLWFASRGRRTLDTGYGIRVCLEGGELFRFAEGIMLFLFFHFYLGCSRNWEYPWPYTASCTFATKPFDADNDG
jgi:hypothetical protein